MEIKHNFKMTDEERGLMLRVADNYSPCLPLLFSLKTHYPKCNLILSYLVRNGLTGEKLFNWIRYELNNSPLTAWKYCLGKIERENNKKIIFGRDFV